MSAHRAQQLALAVLGALLLGYALGDHPFYGGDPGFGWTQAALALAGVALIGFACGPAAVRGGVLLLSATTLVMLGVAELAGELVLGPRLRPVFQADERLIFKLIPERRSIANQIAANGGATIDYRINSAGFRGPELRREGSAPRVVVYGDSYIQASFSPAGQTFADQLAARLNERLRSPLEVINAGVNSYGPDQVSLRMEAELPRLRPDLVIVALYGGNDFGDLMRNKLFRLGPDGALVPNRWSLDPQLGFLFEISQRESILKRAIRLAYRRAVPENNDLGFLLAEAEREYRSYVLENDNVVRNTHTDHYSADLSLAPRSEAARYKVELMHAVLRRIRELAARHDAALAFLLIPHPYDVIERYAGWQPVDRARFPEYAPRNQVAALERLARELGVPYVSLFEPFVAAGAERLYLRGGDPHWNAAGQALAARLMADFLIAEPAWHTKILRAATR